MFRRHAFEQAGGYRTCFVDSEDLDLWLRIAEHHALANLPEPVIDYRVHGQQATASGFELQAREVIAAHLSERARAAGRADPLDGLPAPIEEDWLLAHGVARRQISAEIVKSATWFAKVTGRAGHAEQAEALLDAAEARARSEPRPGTLLATVHRARAVRRAEQGRRVRARVERGRARLAERRG